MSAAERPRVGPVATYLQYADEVLSAVRRVLEGGSYILGDEVAAFENELARFCGAAGAIGVGNGTDAIELGLRAVGVEPGDTVITVSHTAVATVAAIEHCGAVPVLVDVDPGDLTMAPDALADTIEALRSAPSNRIGAIVPVHLYGQPARMDAIMAIADGHGIRVVEDCAQAHGARHRGIHVGVIGAAGSFSFYPTKNLGAFGDGGAVISRHSDIASRVARLRQYGWGERFVSDEPGINSRLDEMHAAILRVLLRDLDAANARRRCLAYRYDDALKETSIVRPPLPNALDEPVFHQYVVRTDDRDGLRAELLEAGFATGIHYPVPVHLQPAYVNRISAPAGLTVTEAACARILSLPIAAPTSEQDVDDVSTVIVKRLRRQL